MSNLQIIEELSKVIEVQSVIIRAQNLRLGELGAVFMEDEIAKVDETMRRLLGDEEAPHCL